MTISAHLDFVNIADIDLLRYCHLLKRKARFLWLFCSWMLQLIIAYSALYAVRSFGPFLTWYCGFDVRLTGHPTLCKIELLESLERLQPGQAMCPGGFVEPSVTRTMVLRTLQNGLACAGSRCRDTLPSRISLRKSSSMCMQWLLLIWRPSGRSRIQMSHHSRRTWLADLRLLILNSLLGGKRSIKTPSRGLLFYGLFR
jgi:hypothetical protein